MSYIPPHACPTCQHPLAVREMICGNCATTVRGEWIREPLAGITGEQQTFLLLFVRSRGNLSEVERALGVSYPTVRAKLEDLIQALELTPPAEIPSPNQTRTSVLEAVERGDVSVSDALESLRQLRG